MMTVPTTAQLAARLDSLREQNRALEAAIPTDALRAQVGERCADELERLSNSEAAQYLRSVDDSRVQATYLIVSERLPPGVLAEICLEYLANPGFNTRLTGALGIGSCLKRTFDREASRALAQMIRNAEEANEIRFAAYGSLELINWATRPVSARTVAQDELRKEIARQSDNLECIDWVFVDSFL